MHFAAASRTETKLFWKLGDCTDEGCDSMKMASSLFKEEKTEKEGRGKLGTR
jgi:hypothetical protein